MATAVKSTGGEVTPEALRTYLARHRLTHTRVATRYGCGRSYITGVVNGSEPASQQVLRRIRDIAQQIVWERELPRE